MRIAAFILAICLIHPLLNGQELVPIRVGVKSEPPYVIKTAENEFSGLSVDLWKQIAAQQNVSFEYVEFNDHLGLIRALDFMDIDISINPLNVNEIRMRMFELSHPFFVSSIGVATTSTKRSQLGIFIRNFFSIDFLRMILLLILIIFIFGTILWITERKHNRRQFRSGLAGLFDGLWWSAVTMTTVGYGDKTPKSKTGRIIAIIWMFAAIIIISAFTATIASTLTVKSLRIGIEQINDLKHIPQIGSVYGSSSEEFLRKNEIPIYRYYEDPEEALNGLANKEIEVLLYDRTVIDFLITRLQLGKKVSLLPVNFNKQYRSFFLPHESEILEWVNPLLVRNTNAASWQDLLKKYNLHEE